MFSVLPLIHASSQSCFEIHCRDDERTIRGQTIMMMMMMTILQNGKNKSENDRRLQ
jgi:hypothetical protein